MFFDVCGVDTFAIRAHAIEVLINVGDTVFPDLILPIGRRQLVFQRRLRARPAAPDTVQGRGLTSLFLQSHLREQVFNAAIERGLRIFVNVHPTILVKIDPAVVVDAFLLARLLLPRQT